MKTMFVYIMANEARTTYIGVTGDLERRVWQHKHGTVPGFSARHGLDKLVYRETFESPRDAIAREKQLKGWRRSKKVALINAQNPGWDDLAAGWYGGAGSPVPSSRPEASPVRHPGRSDSGVESRP